MTLRDEWIDRIFQRLTGVYGSQFTAKFKQIVDGVDEGTANAKGVWAKELGNFNDKPESIAYALDHLPTDHAPNALEFRDICRRAPKKEVPQVEYKPTAEDEARAKVAINAAVKSLTPKDSDGIDCHWGTHPRSEMQLKMIFQAAARDQRFASCVAEMVRKGICTEDGHLLKIYKDQQWHHAQRRAA